MTLKENIESFSRLGALLCDSIAGLETPYHNDIQTLIEGQHLVNPWFTADNVRTAISSIARQLTTANLEKWMSAYPGAGKEGLPLKAGIVMAGNIPLAGFHDYLAVLLSGNDLVVKTSTKDSDTIQLITRMLCDINPGFRERIALVGGQLSGFDVVIATGSDNTSRYFEYYFGKYPHIIRKNRNSIAILDGNETDKELKLLGDDVFLYFGLGCRNVSKIFVPEGYDFEKMIGSWNNYSSLLWHNKYANNYDFHKAVSLVNRETFLDTGFLIMKESPGLSSPVSVLYYEYYKSEEELKFKTDNISDRIQCKVGRDYVPFGGAQSPALWDYADGKDTIEFLLKKKLERVL